MTWVKASIGTGPRLSQVFFNVGPLNWVFSPALNILPSVVLFQLLKAEYTIKQVKVQHGQKLSNQPTFEELTNFSKKQSCNDVACVAHYATQKSRHASK